MMNTANEIQANYEKAKKVILSANNLEQTKTAFQYFKLFRSKLLLHVTERSEVFNYYVGVLTGMLQVKAKQFSDKFFI